MSGRSFGEMSRMQSGSNRHAGFHGLVAWATALVLACLPAPTRAQEQGLKGVVADQTGLPLPGVRLALHPDEQVVASVTTGFDGAFELAPGLESDTVEAA